MNKTLFSSSFYFTEYHFTKYRSTNNTHGISTHYVGYMRKGHARLVSEEGETEVREGDLFYIPYGCRYRSYWYGEPDICFDSYSFTHFPEEGEEGFCLQTVPMTAKAREALEALAGDKRVSCRSVAWQRSKAPISLGLGAALVLLLTISSQPYAAVFAFALLAIKGLMLIKWR